MSEQNFLLDRLQEVLPQIAENAEKCEQARKVPDENIALLKGIGLHKAFLPKAYGGYEISLPEFSDCVSAIAGACGSTAWAFSLLCTHNHQLAMFPKQLQDEIWGENPDAVASSSIAPFAKIEEVEGGIRIISGEMGWSSGVDHADWAIIGCNRIGKDGEKIYSFAVLPKSDYTIVDNWYALAMKGSGSKIISIKDVFVPEHRIQSAKNMMEGKSAGFGMYPDSKVFFAPYRPYFASGFAAIGLGIAERMLVAFKEKTQNRVRAYTGANVGTATPALMRLAESTHQIGAARAYLEKTLKDIREHAERQEYPTREVLAGWRTNQAYCVKMCIDAVDRLVNASGASIWMEGNEIQRLFRDMHITGSHAYTDYDVCAQILGREIMGLEPDPTMV
ncbi:p-hydroxyphenylacetate 3-hydroxylase oxygenase component [Wohlfahrtiimonas chitiniclastica]|uniref:p-hydroxyphenylacetate 3-hydroxylase oxygenase component n=1 Tax=Wohlfahrtiimonas chitiniclastica TaxID=400946 RepID=UPI001BCCE8DF|nr:flavin-dependent monooxygenase [Wohlfahrtiimonas chitiniclastica]MBS7838422.1 flavin-dependent monooxygenase [Wohlfahrtiimonas chitiniclastica]